VLTKALKNILSTSDIKTQLRISRQFIPSTKELKPAKGFTDDPMHEKNISIGHANEFIHKYPDKILVISSNQCAVLCRFCTRKRVTYQNISQNDLESPSTDFIKVVEYIQKHKDIQEVIFSGGDPFMLSNKNIQKLLDIFLRIPQIKKIRFHSRALTVLPERFNTSLFTIFTDSFKKYPDKQALLVLHINHPEEISKKALDVIHKFMKCGFSILCQTVLLRHVNDDVQLLQDLFKKLIYHGIKPYYLHQLDKVTGSSHFEVSIENGIKLIESLRNTLPLCIIPPYVIDGSQGKKRII